MSEPVCQRCGAPTDCDHLGHQLDPLAAYESHDGSYPTTYLSPGEALPATDVDALLSLAGWQSCPASANRSVFYVRTEGRAGRNGS
jgi:hypothetical protein